MAAVSAGIHLGQPSHDVLRHPTQLSPISAFLHTDCVNGAQMVEFDETLKLLQLEKANSISYIGLTLDVSHSLSHNKGLHTFGNFFVLFIKLPNYSTHFEEQVLFQKWYLPARCH